MRNNKIKPNKLHFNIACESITMADWLVPDYYIETRKIELNGLISPE